eukprot:scaffold7329_cov117-Cylindrotheca_fusiformis.AAC.3
MAQVSFQETTGLSSSPAAVKELRCKLGSVEKPRMTARTVSVLMHLRISCSRAKDMPKVDLPVPLSPWWCANERRRTDLGPTPAKELTTVKRSIDIQDNV